jgi:hypothetical protein
MHMASTSQQPRRRGGVTTVLDGSIQALNLAKDTCGVPPAQVAFGSASAFLTMIKVHIPLSTRTALWLKPIHIQTPSIHREYVILGLACADACKALCRRLKDDRLDELGPLAFDAIGDLTA